MTAELRTEYPRRQDEPRADRGKLVYLIGEPGIGKSTVMRELTRPWAPSATLVVGEPITRTMFLRPDGTVLAVELGRPRLDYPGTDTLAMDAVVPAERYLRSGGAAAETSLLLAEGARLANARFLTAAVESGWRVDLVHLTGPKLAEARRAVRGSHQNESWGRGRATAARRLADNPPKGVASVIGLPAAASPAELARFIVRMCAPELAAPWHTGWPS